MSKECPECGEEFDSINEEFIMHRTYEHNLLLSDQLKKAMSESENSSKSEVDNQ